MKIALCTTTIHVPRTLWLMRKGSSDVRFFVAADEKTPLEAFDLVNALECDDQNAAIFPYYDKFHKWKCSEAIGPNTLARRNIAFLEALKWGADIIYSWDDDNLPVSNGHFDLIQCCFQSWPYAGGDSRYNGIKVFSSTGWFDPGSLLIPATRHRGIPWDNPTSGTRRADPIINANIGVVAGLVIGDPDCDATTRMEHHPDIGGIHILGSTGVVVDPHIWTVFNSQNTAVIRELIPAWFMMPEVGRHDDIYASLVVQRVARDRDYHVHFGPPFTYQERNEHDLIKDLRSEIDGIENTRKLAELLDGIILPNKSVVGDVRSIYTALQYCKFIPRAAADAALLWLEDIETVL